MSEHTPGPWVYSVETGSIWHSGSWVGEAKMEEDGRLMAAATDLLAACKTALEVIMSAQATIYGEWGCPLPEYDFVTEQLRDAIAKAEGREP